MSDTLKPQQRAFLTAYAETGNVKLACELAEIARSNHYLWLEDPAYVEAFERAKEEAIESLEMEARRRAVEGVPEPVFYKGDECGRIRKYSDTLLIFLLNGMAPQKYRKDIKVEHTGPGGGPMRGRIDLSNLTDEQLSTLEQLARAAAQPGPHRGGEAAEGAAEDGPDVPVNGTIPTGAVPEAP